MNYEDLKRSVYGNTTDSLDIQEVGFNESSWFYKAAESGDVKVLKYLIDLKPDDRLRSSMLLHVNNNYSFIVAVRNGQLEVLKYLISITEFENILRLQITPNQYESVYLNVQSYLTDLNNFLQSVRENNMQALNDLFGIIRDEGKIFGINKETSITLDLVKKAINHYQGNYGCHQSLELLKEIAAHGEGQRKQMIDDLTEHVMEDVSKLIIEYIGSPVVMHEDPPSFRIENTYSCKKRKGM